MKSKIITIIILLTTAFLITNSSKATSLYTSSNIVFAYSVCGCNGEPIICSSFSQAFGEWGALSANLPGDPCRNSPECKAPY